MCYYTRKINSFPCKGQFNKSGNFSLSQGKCNSFKEVREGFLHIPIPPYGLEDSYHLTILSADTGDIKQTNKKTMKKYQADFPWTEKKKSFVLLQIRHCWQIRHFLSWAPLSKKPLLASNLNICPIHGQVLPCDLYFTTERLCNLRFAIFTVACISGQK